MLHHRPRALRPVPTVTWGPTPDRFVGRAHELGVLVDLLARDSWAPGALRLLGGEPGIGKTRLAHELAKHARSAGARVTWGRCWDETGAPPFWPWTQAIRGLLGLSRGTELGPLVLDEPGADRFELFDATVDVLRRTARRGSVVIVLDDLHHADAPSLVLTRFVAQQLEDVPLLILGTYRPADVSGRPDIAEQIDALRELGGELMLGGLGVDEVGELLIDPREADDVHAITGGNPLFIEQVRQAGGTGRRSLEPFGAVRSHGAASPGASTPSASLRAGSTTEALRSAVSTRIAALPEAARGALAAAAVFGTSRPIEDVGAILETPTDAVAEQLSWASRAGLLRMTADGQVELSHPLVVEVAAQAVPMLRREALHRHAARLLVEQPDRLAERAHHLLHGGPAVRGAAVLACRRAAEAATQALAHEDAAWHLRRALGALDESALGQGDGGDRDRVELLLGLAAALWRSTRTIDADAVFDQAWHVAVRSGDADLQARAALRNGIRYCFTGEGATDGADRTRTALAVQPPGASLWRARLLADLATRHVVGAAVVTGQALAAEALAMARSLGDQVAIGYGLIAEQVTALGPATLSRRLDSAREILALAASTGEYQLELHGRFLLMGALLERGDTRGLDAELARQHHVADQLAEPRFARFALWFRCTRAMLEGRRDRVEQLAEETLALSTTVQDPDALGVYGAQLGVSRWMEGRLLEMECLYADQRSADPDEPLWPALLAWIWADHGHIDAARGALATVPDPGTIPETQHWLLTMVMLAEAAVLVGDDDLAERLWDQLLPYGEHVVSVAMGAACWGPAARPLGRLALHLGHVDDGLAHLARAVDACARIGARPWLAESQLELAAGLLVHRPGDERIAALVREATAIATRLGLVRLVERAAKLAAEVGLTGSADGQTRPLSDISGTDHDAAPVADAMPTVSVLGTFQVAAADGTVARWTSRKARELLKVLVARRGSPVGREVLMDLLWPGEDPATLGNRLSVAISTVRRALDPARTRPTNDLVAADSTSVWLRLDRVVVDVEEFLDLARDALDAVRLDGATAAPLLDRALAAYRGEALADEPYAEWAPPLRGEARAAYATVARRAAELAVEGGDHVVAAEAHRRVLDIDPYDEPAHLGLVTAFREMGAHGQADRAYQRYVGCMAELDLPAAGDPTRTSP